MQNKLKKNKSNEKFANLPIRTIFAETNTNAQAEECFKIKKYSSRLNENMNIVEFLKLNFLDNLGIFRTSAEAFIRELVSLKSKDKKKFSKAQQLCQNMLIDQDGKSKITKQTKIPSTSSENESEVDDSKEDQAKAAKEEWFDKHKKSKRKRSSLYLNETIESIVLEPRAKRSKVQRIPKNSKAFQDAKKKAWKTESKLHTRYSKINKAAEGKAKKFIEQEALENLETEEDGYYKCEFCSVVTKRPGLIHCSHCKKWYHATCFPMAFEYSLKQAFIICRTCLIEMYHEICTHIFMQPTTPSLNYSKLSSISNANIDFSLANKMYGSKQKKTFEFSLPTELAQRGFMNKKSNCWVSSILQVLYYTPLQEILKMSTSQVATYLIEVFTNMKVNTIVPMSVMQLEKITKLCKMEMSTSLHQDIDEFYDNIIDALLNDDMIALLIKSFFEIPVTGINRCLQCNDIKIEKHMDSYHSIKLPVTPLNRSSVVNINSILWCHFTSDINKENMVCSKCQNKDGVHQTKFIDNFPEHFFLIFERNQYNFQTKYSKLVDTRIKCEDKLNLSFCSMADICGTPYNYTLISAVARSGGRSVNKGHFTTYVFKEDEIILYDDEKIIKVDDDDLLLNVKFQREVVATMYKKVAYEREIDDLIEINLWEITKSQRNTVDNIFCQTEDSDLGHVRVHSLQSLKQSHWLNSEAMDVIFDYVAATRSDTVSFSHIMMKQGLSESILESQIRKISFDTNRIIIPVIHCSHWFSMIVYFKEKIVICLDSFYKTKKVDMFERVFFLLSMVFREINSKEWTLLQPNTLPPQIDGSSCGMHAILNVWFLLHIGETYNKTDIRKARYWFANEVMNMKVQQSKNNDIKLMEGQAQTISKDDILEVIGKGKPFTLLKELINNKKEHLSDKFIPLLPNDVFTLTDSEDSTENEDKDESSNVALLKFIENNGEYLRKVVDGTSKDVVFSERLEALKVLPSKKIEQIASEELSIIEKNRKEYGQLYFYTNELMFGPLTTEREKKIESYPFKVKVKESYPIKIKPRAMTKDTFISNILIVEAIIKYEMLRYSMSYKQVTQNIYLDILPTTYHEELMAKVIFSISVLNFFPIITFKPSSIEEAYNFANMKLKISFC